MPYPKLIIGEGLVQATLSSVQKTGRVFVCSNPEQTRDVVNSMMFLDKFDGEIAIFLPNPTRRQYDTLLKFMEQSQLHLILCIPKDSAPSTIVSRSIEVHKEEKPEFNDYIDKVLAGTAEDVHLGESLKSKISDLFDRKLDET